MFDEQPPFDLIRFIKSNFNLVQILLHFLSISLLVYIAFFLVPKDNSITSNPSVQATEFDFVESNESSSSYDITVDLSGAVNSPGVYTLKNDARIFDLLSLGSGVSKDADIDWIFKNLNMSLRLQDEQKVYIPFVWDTYIQDSNTVISFPGVEKTKEHALTNKDNDKDDKSTPDSSGKINLNTATAEQLEELPGIGPKYAQDIINNRPYMTIGDFVSNSGLPKGTIDKFKGDVVVE